MVNERDQKILLDLARKTIESILRGEEFDITEAELSEELKERRSSFVTLTEEGKLRGCIGKLQAMKALYKDVIENAESAAFGDPRFPKLTEEELDKIQIEISVLEPAKTLKYKNAEDLLSKLGNLKPGVVIQDGYRRATFLPQVWEQIGDPEEFLSNLCLKAGMSAKAWKNKDLQLMTYEVQKFSE